MLAHARPRTWQGTGGQKGFLQCFGLHVVAGHGIRMQTLVPLSSEVGVWTRVGKKSEVRTHQTIQKVRLWFFL